MLDRYVNFRVTPSLEIKATRAPLEFHHRLPGYSPSPLVNAKQLATELGIGKLWIKDESLRFGLPAYKVLGGSWATYKTLESLLLNLTGGRFKPWQTLEELAVQLEPLRPLTLIAPTDGNHGRGIARMAKLLKLECRIYVPKVMVEARRQAIRDEGAEVVVIDGTYDDAVARTIADSNDKNIIVSDFAWEGYEQTPRWVLEGYSSIFWEIDEELSRLGETPPDVIFVQVGCGAFAASVVQHYRRADLKQPSKIVSVEPDAAPCVIESIRTDKLLTVKEDDSIMAGLICGTPSLVAYPLLEAGVDLFMTVTDDDAKEAMRLCAKENIVSGESGAAGLAGLYALLNSPQAVQWREQLGLHKDSSVLVFSTEGATDPLAYESIVGQIKNDQQQTQSAG
jgi:diaminopropionate ammonia-lyase